jgi:hypothetical protein
MDNAHREKRRPGSEEVLVLIALAVVSRFDGDIEKVAGKAFCAAAVARSLALEAKHVGAGRTFSVAVVFAIQEFETWLIAGTASLTGRRLPDGRLIPT